jgi:hypothetical protein
MSDDDEKLAERIARERWNAVLVADGQRMTGIADWDGLSQNARDEVLADVEATLDAIRAEVERLRAVLRQCACSCKALRESCPELEMDGTCPHLSAQESLEGKL